MRAFAAQLCLVGTMFVASACIPQSVTTTDVAEVSSVADTADAADEDELPLYGGCKEWRPKYGPKPKRCRRG